MPRMTSDFTPLLLLLQASFLYLSQATCPGGCSCYGNSVSCSGTNRNTVPNNLSPETHYLYLDSNSFDTISANALSNLTELKLLNISHNKISYIEDGAFNGLSKLEKLVLSSNNISTIQSGVFAPLRKLSVLILSDNCFSLISPETIGSIPSLLSFYLEDNREELTILPKTFAGLPNLTLLRLRSSRIVHLPPLTFSGLGSVLTLELSSNQLVAIRQGVFDGLSSIKYLWLDGNEHLQMIEKGAFKSLGSLNHLNLTACSLVDMSQDPFEGLSSLRELFMSWNHLEAVPPNMFCSTPDLITLDLAFNPLKYIDSESFACLMKVRTLRLNGGKLTRIAEGVLTPLTELAVLSLNDNQISDIALDSFRGKEKLSKLELESNALETLNASLFSGVTTLHTLHLHINQIRTLPAGIFDDLQVPLYLTLRGNPLLCDCAIDWLEPWLDDTGGGIDKCQCDQPPALHGLHFYSIAPSRFHCAPYQTNDPIEYRGKAGSVDFGMACPIDAKPAPSIYWLTPSKERITEIGDHGVYQVDVNGSLVVGEVSMENAGEFMCVAENDLGYKSVAIVLEVSSKGFAWIAAIVMGIVIIVVLVVAFSPKKVRRDCWHPRKARHAWKAHYDPLNANLDPV